jgi:toxin FitB
VLVAARTRLGLAISTEDAQIAAIALVHGLELATRNARDFREIDGLTVLNPWA